jgi:threonylcarbamoyladenosine tRNA methylthiotransferase MtaB
LQIDNLKTEYEHFKETYAFLNELEISYLHVFTYSERPNTHALNIRPIVLPHIRAERSKMLHILSEKKRRAFYESQLGTSRNVLWEAEIDNGQMHGFTENYVKVSATYDPACTNEIRKINLDRINNDGTLACTETDTYNLSH